MNNYRLFDNPNKIMMFKIKFVILGNRVESINLATLSKIFRGKKWKIRNKILDNIYTLHHVNILKNAK